MTEQVSAVALYFIRLRGFGRRLKRAIGMPTFRIRRDLFQRFNRLKYLSKAGNRSVINIHCRIPKVKHWKFPVPSN